MYTMSENRKWHVWKRYKVINDYIFLVYIIMFIYIKWNVCVYVKGVWENSYIDYDVTGFIKWYIKSSRISSSFINKITILVVKKCV